MVTVPARLARIRAWRKRRGRSVLGAFVVVVFVGALVDGINQEHLSANQRGQRQALIGGCDRQNVRTVEDNVSELADYNVYLVIYNETLAATASTPMRKRESSLFLSLLAKSIAAKAWVPKVDCASALATGGLYASPPAVPFSRRMPPASALHT